MATQKAHKNCQHTAIDIIGSEHLIPMSNTQSGFVPHWSCRVTDDLVADVEMVSQKPIVDKNTFLSVLLESFNEKHSSDLKAENYDFSGGKWNRAKPQNEPKATLKADIGNQNALLLKVIRGETLNKAEMSLLSEKLAGDSPASQPVAKVEPVVEKPKVDVSNTETLAQILKLLSGK